MPSTWTDSFPDNFQWSNATLVCKACALRRGGAREIERICERLRARGRRTRSVVAEWCAEAERNEKLADAAANEAATRARDHYLRAANINYAGERFVPLEKEN